MTFFCLKWDGLYWKFKQRLLAPSCADYARRKNVFFYSLHLIKVKFIPWHLVSTGQSDGLTAWKLADHAQNGWGTIFHSRTNASHFLKTSERISERNHGKHLIRKTANLESERRFWQNHSFIGCLTLQLDDVCIYSWRVVRSYVRATMHFGLKFLAAIHALFPLAIFTASLDANGLFNALRKKANMQARSFPKTIWLKILVEQPMKESETH